MIVIWITCIVVYETNIIIFSQACYENKFAILQRIFEHWLRCLCLEYRIGFLYRFDWGLEFLTFIFSTLIVWASNLGWRLLFIFVSVLILTLFELLEWITYNPWNSSDSCLNSWPCFIIGACIIPLWSFPSRT